MENYKKVESRLESIKRWDESGKEHDFHEMNLIRKLEKATKIEDFRNNYLPKLKQVVKTLEEFNTNSFKIKTFSGDEFLYYSTKGKLKKCNSYPSEFITVRYKSIVKFFSKKEFK